MNTSASTRSGFSVGQAAYSGFAVADRDDFDAALLEREHDHFLDVGVVVGHQNSGHCFPLAARPGGDTPTLRIQHIAAPRTRRRQQTRRTGVLQLLAGSKYSRPAAVYQGISFFNPFFFLLVDSWLESTAGALAEPDED